MITDSFDNKSPAMVPGDGVSGPFCIAFLVQGDGVSGPF